MVCYDYEQAGNQFPLCLMKRPGAFLTVYDQTYITLKALKNSLILSDWQYQINDIFIIYCGQLCQ